MFGKYPRLVPIRIIDTATEETPIPNPNNNFNDLINTKFHKHNDLINIMSSSMLFGKDPRLAPIRIPDTGIEEALNPNPNPNPNDLINVISHEHNDLINVISSSMLLGTDIRLAPIRIPDTATEETPNLNLNPNPNPNINNKTNPNNNNNVNDLINITFHEHNDLINIITSLMLFGKNPCLAPIKIPDTTTGETPNPYLNTNLNPNPNDLINVMSHEHNNLINIITSSMLFGNNPRLTPIRIPLTATEETPNPNYNPNPNPNLTLMT